MLRPVVGFPVVVIGPAVAGAAGFRLAGVGHREFVPGMAVVALVLVGVAHGAAVSDLALRHSGVDLRLDVGPVIQRVRRAAPRPLVLRP